MGFRRFFRDYLEYYPSEKRGVFLLCIIIAIWIGGLFVYSRMPITVAEEDEEFEKAVAAYYESKAIENRKSEVHQPVKSEEQNWNFFAFDPNILSEDSLILLGLSEKVANNIIRYRESGGQFRESDDLSRIYSLTESDFETIRPYIKIKASKESWRDQPLVLDTAISKEKDWGDRNYRNDIVVELNLADTADLRQIFGIGGYFAREIVKRREALGGYRSLEQLLEIYNLDSAHLDKIAPHFTLDTSLVRKININTVSIDKLRRHPYFNYNLANSLVKIREAHGAYSGIEDIRKSHLVNDSIFQLIKPYIIVHE